MKKRLCKILLLMLCIFNITSCNGDVPKEKKESNKTEEIEKGNGGYLFIHMTNKNYGKMFYSISRDGLKWETLNDGKVILNNYLGHPTLTKGGDDKYYMIGVSIGATPHYPILWYSSDLIIWKHKDLDASIFDVSDYNYSNDVFYYGAPKIFYDKSSGQYMITWHDGKSGKDDTKEEWLSKRTFYILTKDFVTFTKAKRLFDFTGTDQEMATIDTIILKEGDTYYAIIKDERWPEDCATGKTIRIATSKNLTGPYTNPGSPITTAWHEAPIVVKSMDNKEWYLYTEHYVEATYDLYKSTSLIGNMWSSVKFTPPVARHGWILKIDENIYQGILKQYSVNK